MLQHIDNSHKNISYHESSLPIPMCLESRLRHVNKRGDLSASSGWRTDSKSSGRCRRAEKVNKLSEVKIKPGNVEPFFSLFIITHLVSVYIEIGIVQ